jgi:FMN phosphatase YigB (HAD superfamily)
VSARESAAKQTTTCVVFFDCDNTLLDNDRVKSDLDGWLQKEFGHAGATRYWEQYESSRKELGYADYLGTVQRLGRDAPGDPRLARLSLHLLQYPFAERVYPGALEAIAHGRTWGITAILSDGDLVFQPHKLQSAGLWDAVDGRVLIYSHKEKSLDDVQRRYPAQHYVMVDDKLSILTSMKAVLQERLTTVWPRQGHYALDPGSANYPAPDLTLERIADVARLDFSRILASARRA